MKNTAKHLSFTFLLCCLSLYANHALALGFGEPQLQSRLGKPLRISIELTNSGELTADDIQVNKAPAAVFEQLGAGKRKYIDTLKFTINKKGNNLFVVITTATPFTEPYFDTIIQAKWANGNINKQITLLIDP